MVSEREMARFYSLECQEGAASKDALSGEVRADRYEVARRYADRILSSEEAEIKAIRQ